MPEPESLFVPTAAAEAETALGAPGLAHSVLWDTGGTAPFGRAVQCLLVAPR